VRTEEKKLMKAIEGKDSKTAAESLIAYASLITKAAQKGVYHAKTASRKVSRLATQVSRLG